jgi:hypothetical protein
MAAFLYMHLDVPLQLVEKLLGFIVVIIFTGIWAGHYHNDIIVCFFVQVFIPYGGL